MEEMRVVTVLWRERGWCGRTSAGGDSLGLAHVERE